MKIIQNTKMNMHKILKLYNINGKRKEKQKKNKW